MLSSVQFSSVTQSCLTLWDPMNCSMPGLPVHHQLPEFTQTHVHMVRGSQTRGDFRRMRKNILTYVGRTFDSHVWHILIEGLLGGQTAQSIEEKRSSNDNVGLACWAIWSELGVSHGAVEARKSRVCHSLRVLNVDFGYKLQRSKTTPEIHQGRRGDGGGEGVQFAIVANT